ncbi:MAG: DUF4091 domain-containing protein [Clostridiales bacterium]|nr:DUF4091 domain-containing protein [Clostridiales bacterium]
MNRSILETRVISSLEKVFLDEELSASVWDKGSMLNNEVYSFQIAYRIQPDASEERVKCKIDLRADDKLLGCLSVRQVISINSDFPVGENHDQYLLRTEPGLYPELLKPIVESVEASKQWQTLWITVNSDRKIFESDEYVIHLNFLDEGGGQELAAESFNLSILDCALPEQTLIHTMWFHTDCIATYYKDEVFSDAHWTRIEQFMKKATAHGINMILTPIFTPPLDTEVGGERPTVQLVDVVQEGDKYQFGFDRLKRWVSLSLESGFKYFEFAHLFTQWGAKHAPKIMAMVKGEEKRIFGWDTDATGPEYENFLDQFLPALVEFINENGLEKVSYFHVSDEPSVEAIPFYESASKILKKHLKGFPIMDALSSYSFYEKGLVEKPIPGSNHIEPFLENNVPDLWTYYCVSQWDKVSNRFFAMPSARNRILGIQLYKFQIRGFLQWGYNFYYSQYSKRAIDPFVVTDCGKAFPSGDPFVVYPGEDGPLDSLRFEVFYDALQDLRALNLLEEKIGRNEVIALLEEGLEEPITFSVYPRDEEWLLNKREQINAMLANC